jgi:outer membrane protein TolC
VNPGKVLLNLIGSIVQPLFNRGQSVANLTIAKAEQEKAVLAFNQALLVAGTELNEALTSCQISHERFIIHQQEAEESQKAYDVSMELMQHGSGTYLEVLSAESSLLQSELALSNDWLDIVQGIIYLCKKISQ